MKKKGDQRSRFFTYKMLVFTADLQRKAGSASNFKPYKAYKDIEEKTYMNLYVLYGKEKNWKVLL